MNLREEILAKIERLSDEDLPKVLEGIKELQKKWELEEQTKPQQILSKATGRDNENEPQ